MVNRSVVLWLLYMSSGLSEGKLFCREGAPS